ncbi:regulatory protein, luxR family [Microlunatus sagamiharensis]|uniref:Regulatory protein, luxR family n=1 Tax=Microlunatus sagamiharensis TaxID=546874 RepID=A0A1H2LVY2_9ACTN|nr:LuxR family transcriptional regulator [Microlunatus sagamiharensis]SDU85163.1 regulatory protein, luxR family [Microlunatus sagamiharensis]
MADIPAGAGPLVGRDRVLERVRRVAENRGPTGRSLLVTGPPGSGRTSLVATALADLDGEVVWFAGSATVDDEPWSTLRSARGTFRSVPGFLGSGGDEVVARALAGESSTVEVARAFARHYQSLPPRPGAVVLVAEDVHRFDPQSRAVLLLLAHVNHTFDMSYVLTCPTRALPEDALDLDRVQLGPLDAGATREALHAWTGRPVGTDVAAELARLTDGNPRLLREIAGQVGPEQLEGRRTLPLRLPLTPTSAAVASGPLQDLDVDALRTLACFSLGLPVPVVVLERAVGLGPVDALVDANLLEAVPEGYRCTSALLGRTAEARLDAATRHALAGALASAWSVLDPVRAALHAVDEGLPSEEVLERGRRALATTAGASSAADDRLAEALAWAVVARAEPPTTNDWLVLAGCAERAGHLADARDAFEHAVHASAIDEEDLPLLTRTRGFLSQVTDDRTLVVPSTTLLSSLELVHPAVVFETMTRTAWNSLLAGAPDQARLYLDRARQASRAARPEDRALWRLVDTGWQRAASGTGTDEALREAALRWRDCTGARPWYDDFLLVTTLVEAHALADARQHLFVAGSAHRHAGRLGRYFLLAARLELEVAGSQVAAALATVEELAGHEVAGPVHVRGLAPALVRLETLADLPAGTLVDGHDGSASEPAALARAEAERALVRGRHREAAVALTALLRAEPPLPEEARRAVLADLVEAQVAAGDLAGAQQSFVRSTSGTGGPATDAATTRAAALVASPFETRGAFARALAAAEAEDGLLGRARTLLALSRRLGAVGAEDEAAGLREEAALVFAHLGAEGWARHAREAEPPPQDPGAQDRLLDTRLDDHEAGIVRLLLLGQKNKEVAARLYVSLRSLEKSLTRIYAKTGVASKAQLLALVRAEDGAGRPTGPRSAVG